MAVLPYLILPSAALAAFFGVLLATRRRSKKFSRDLPLPPGPKANMFFGHLFKLPAESSWEVYHQWCKDLGSDIIHLDILGSSVIVLDTATAAMDLIEKRSSIYSDRPRFPMVNELMGWSFNMGTMRYGDEWRSHRQLFHRFFHPSAAAKFQPQEVKATREMLGRLLNDDQNFSTHFRHMAGAVIMSIAYGIQVLPHNDPYIAASEKGVRPVINAVVPGAYLVDRFPLLRYVPEWMPFAGFQHKAREFRRLGELMRELPFSASQLMDTSLSASFTACALAEIDENSGSVHQREVIKNTAATMYIGGSDATTSILSYFVLAMLKNPEAQAKAQQELDATLERGYLPSFQDQKNLPYVAAIVMEVLRWGTTAPLAAPHRLTVDDVYRGYRLPAGSTILCNAWAMLHDENEYPDPFSFNPDRFLRDGKIDPAVKDPRAFVFGFGRRVCPARYMAYSSAWIAVASILSVFDITKAIADDGSYIDPAIECTGTLACAPAPFKCSIRPRSQEARATILSALED